MKSKKSIFANKSRIWFYLYVFFSVTYLIWRIFFTIPFGYGVISITAGVLLLVVETLGLIEALVHYVNMYNTKDYEKPEIPDELFPDVDVFVATYNEEADLLRKTLLACKRMDYPDKSKVHIYVCDDGHRENIKMLAAQLGVNYLDRENHDGQKAGNLNNALKHSSSPYVVTFDADMIPQSCFLLETIPYFVDAELRNKGKEEKDKIKLGFLQTPQSFYDLDLFQFNLYSEAKIPNEQDYFYRDIEVARTRTNSCIYGGSNTVLSREALDAIGGFYTEAITEDFATGLLIQKKGYVSLAISKRLASGISAKTLKDLVQQRVRWARGVISTGRKLHIYTSKELSFGQKINYWASIWYWYAPLKRFIYIMCPLLYSAFGFMIFRCELWQVLLFWLPMYVTSNMSLKRLSNNIRNVKWTSIYEYALFPYMLIPVILESFGFSLKTFKVTSKEAASGKSGGLNAYKIPILLLVILSAIGVIRSVITIFESGSLGPSVVLFWLLFNLFNMIMCLFFLDGRTAYRKAERVVVQVEGELNVDSVPYRCTTHDISETGLALFLDKPILVPSQNECPVYVILRDRRWEAKLWVEVLHSKKVENTQGQGDWIYSFSIVKFDSDESYDNYLAILYDRIPTNPSEIRKNNGMYDDLSFNISQRTAKTVFLKRQYPRISVNADITLCMDGKNETVKLLDFNYMFLAVEGSLSDKEIEGKEVVSQIGEFKIHTVFERKFKNTYLLKVKEFEQLYIKERKRDDVMDTVLVLAKKKGVC